MEESILQKELESLKEYLVSIENDYEMGVWIVKIGFPSKWVIGNNNLITIEIVVDTPDGKLVKIRPNTPEVTIDMLFEFIKLIIQTNLKIAEKQKEFEQQLKEMQDKIKEDTKIFYNEINQLNQSQTKILDEAGIIPKKIKTRTPRIVKNIEDNKKTDTEND